MRFVIIGDYPYYYDGSHVFPCEVSAKEVTVDFTAPLDAPENVSCVYSESEICKPFGIKMVDAWDAKNGKQYKKSNSKIKSTEKTYKANGKMDDDSDA